MRLYQVRAYQFQVGTHPRCALIQDGRLSKACYQFQPHIFSNDLFSIIAVIHAFFLIRTSLVSAEAGLGCCS